jgi:hypothetical protein
MSEKSTLSVGKYTIELSKAGSEVFAVSLEGQKEWICTSSDPERAMTIVEGLIMVEMKRFYHPESKPKVNNSSATIVPFLKNNQD